ncbi:hypothetical protein GMA43_12045 [Turicibacter sanguinis]|nr:hypothetical protein [Turicibacter sanguinis]MTH10914.1 hypothetical protein [Turicibacter sanguinis]MTH13695.1 hypothetical protein [Turicibacter sanguinis]MTH20888.1 hypothetical protein [Turicibacter sanguinis]MTH41653.1 hypothetical protein [Turicibacter sanguinis]
MIIEIKEDLLTEVARFAWEFERQQETCSFPKYKDFGDLYERFSKSLNDNEDKVLAYIEDQELIGVLTLQVKSQDLYLQSLGGIFAKRDFNRVASKFIDYLRDHYLNFELFFGYPIENQVAISYLESIQAELLDACVTMKLQKEDFMSITPHHEVIPLPKERYAEYAIFHDTHHPNLYWNSKRIFEHLDLWKIYVGVDQDSIVGSLFIRCNSVEYEIFGLSLNQAYQNQGLELDLLSVSLEDCLNPSLDYVLFFVDEETPTQIEATLRVGFKPIDTYRCYKIQL